MKTSQNQFDRRRHAAAAIRHIGLAVVLLAGLATSVGCFVPLYSARPERRVQQLLYTSDDLRSMTETWERFWFLDSPSHMTPIRTHGGIM